MKLARRIVFGLGLAFASSLLAGSAISAYDVPNETTQDPLWSEEQWPFPIDQWGTGRAFKCTADQCGSEVRLYLRPKIGFCRCATGVSDDDEIDRVGDLELISADYKPLAPGHAVTAGIMTGRARLFSVERPFQSPTAILSIAMANKCDAIVATVVAKADVQSAQEGQALNFLRGAAIQHWVESQTGSG